MTRYAIVQNARSSQELEAYLPANYKIIGTKIEDMDTERLVFAIEGRDVAGWTMDDYVVPRLGSGLIWADEVGVDELMAAGFAPSSLLKSIETDA